MRSSISNHLAAGIAFLRFPCLVARTSCATMAASSDIQLPAKWADLAEFIEKASPHGRRKVVIDCDPGVDDAEAIMMLMQAPNVDVVAITCVNGNTNSKQAALNAQWILSLFPEQKVPIYVGADAPLLSPVEDAHYFHGPNGLACPPDADEQHRIATSPSTIQPENAVDALLRLGREYLVTRATPAGRHSRTLNQLAQYHQWQEDNVRQQLAAAVSSEDYDLAADLKHDAYECGRRKVACLHASRHGEDTYPGLDILALGPLTNLALAARLDHGFPATVRSLMVMGGTSKGQGRARLSLYSQAYVERNNTGGTLSRICGVHCSLRAHVSLIGVVRVLMVFL
eukprot:TRINITY_DN9272_c0_g1_i2.p1 TRINITY_DN9272_c0_g1~~TRINITY_DN9272_c0_g1_i2.p1  ORF type:complete len:341 (+),score=39.83 TRINITY_DN9272_c0_g1_i2:151-1173(+)